jgi:uncharacterized protein involved in exopolysaccharide biosynthesis
MTKPIKKNFQRADADWPTAARIAVQHDYRLIGIVCAACAIIATIYLILAPLKYTAHAVIAPADQSSQSGNAASLARSLGLGARTGVSEYFDEFQRTIKSEDVATGLAKKGWVKRLFANSWDESCQCWKSPTIGRIFQNARARIFGGPYWHPPDSYELYGNIEKNLNFTPVGETDMQEITFTYNDAKTAEQFLAAAISLADTLVRQRSQVRAQASRDYLLAEVRKSDQVEFRQSILTLLTEQERILATVSSPQMYSARLVLGATAPPQPSSPRVSLILLLAFLGGGGLGFIFAFARALRMLTRESVSEAF